MSALTRPGRKTFHYPDSDGLPMSDNTVQFDWIAILKWGAEAAFRDDPNVFVAGDHLIYPVEDDVLTRQAPDVYVAFGPHKGDRGSYKVWEEGGVFPQVVFEVWSPGNKYDQMRKKFEFYEQFGAEEYYIVYPEFPAHVEGWVRASGKLEPVPAMNGYVSPRLGFRFRLVRGELDVFGPDGRPLVTPVDLSRERDEAERARDEAERARDEAERERDAAAQARDAEREKSARLAARLRELGIDPDAV